MGRVMGRAAMALGMLAACSASGSGGDEPRAAQALAATSAAVHMDWRPMYSGLGSEDAAAITTQLKAVAVPFAVTDGGRTILAPKDQIDSGRIAVAGQRLPRAATFRSPWRVTSAPKSQKCRLMGLYAQVPEVLGMSESDARSYNQALGRTTRLVAKDGRCQYLRMDLRADRTNIWLVHDRVVAAQLG